MKNSRKSISYSMALAIIILLLTSATSLPEKLYAKNASAGSPNVTVKNKATVIKVDISPQFLSIQGEKVTVPLKHRSTRGSWPAFSYLGDQNHPAFGRTITGTHMAAYHDTNLANILWTFSNDDGVTYSPGVNYNKGGDYPSIKLWGGSTFYGTYVTDPNDHNGGATYLFNCSDPTNSGTYSMNVLDWSLDGWSNMTDADIACDNSQNPWEWGISTYVMSTTHGQGYINGPTIVYADPAPSGQMYIDWYWVNGCAHTDVDIDPVTHMAYAIYDWYNTTSSKWELLVRVLDFADPVHGYDALFEIQGTGNLQYPAVAVYGNNLVILAHTDKSGAEGIICYHSDNGMNGLQTNYLLQDPDCFYPDVRSVNDNDFIGTFVKENNISSSKTEDGGTSWNTSVQINGNNGVVVEEYKTSDLCEQSQIAMWEEQHNDSDIYIGDIWINNRPPKAPSVDGPIIGKQNVTYHYTLNTTDPERNKVFYYVNWGDETNTGWIGPYPPGETVNVSHSWRNEGGYLITVTAKDIYDAESHWSTLPMDILNPTLARAYLFGVFPRYLQGPDLILIEFRGLYIGTKPFSINITLHHSLVIVIDNATKKGIFKPNAITFQGMPAGLIIGKFYATILPNKNSNSLFSSQRPFYGERRLH